MKGRWIAKTSQRYTSNTHPPSQYTKSSITECFQRHQHERLSVQTRGGRTRKSWQFADTLYQGQIIPLATQAKQQQQAQEHEGSTKTFTTESQCLTQNGNGCTANLSRWTPSTLPKTVQWARLGSRNQHWHHPKRFHLLDNNCNLAWHLVLRH